MIPRKTPNWLLATAFGRSTVQRSLPIFAVATLSSIAMPVQAAPNVPNEFIADGYAELTDGTAWSFGTAPVLGEDAVIPHIDGGTSLALDGADLTVGSLNFLNTNGTIFLENQTSGSTNSILTLGGTGNGTNAVSGASSSDLLYVQSGGNLVLSGTNPNGGTGVLKLALGQNGSFNIAGSSTISSEITGAFGFDKTGAGTLTLSNLANTFSGGMAIKAGTVLFNSSATAGTRTNGGTGTITIGDSANTGAAAKLELNLGAGITYGNAIAIAGNGLNTINLANYFSNFTNNVSLAGNLVASTTNINNSNLRFTGAVSGAGNLTTKVGGNNTGSTVEFAAVNMVGTVTNSGTGVGSALFNGAIGSNVTGVIQDSATSTMVLNNASNTFSGLQILNGKVILKYTGSQGSTASTITLGNSGNTGAAATLEFNGAGIFSGAFSNALSVVGNGVNTLTVTGYAPTYSGAIRLNNSNLNVVSNNPNNSTITVSGGVTGVGNLNLQVIGINGASSVLLNTTAINNTGTITNSGTGVGQAIINAAIGSNVTGVVQTSATSVLNLRGTNSFTGGITIKAGQVNVRGKALGDTNATNVGTITLGDVANTGASARLNVEENGIGSTGAGSNAINVVGTGTRTISVSSWNPILSGAVTLNSTDLNIVSTNNAGSNITFTGGVTGVGNLILQSNGTTNNPGQVQLTTTTINNTGTITNSGTGARTSGTGTNLNTLISASIGSNVTGVVQNSLNSSLILSGDNSSYFGNTVVSLGTLQLTTTGVLGFVVGANGVSNSITGTNAGILTLDGSFVFDLTNAAADGSWNIVDVNNLNETYGSGFKVNGAGWAETANDNIWRYTDTKATYTFSQATGVLTGVSFVPEPSGFMLLSVGVIGLVTRRKREI